MASTMEKKENNVVVLTIDVPAADFVDALQRSFRKNAGRFNVPGFRKGKAPMQIVTKYYGEGVLYDDAIDFAATPAYTAAIAEHGLEPVSRPDMDILEIGREKGIKFTVTVTVKPEVTLGQYFGVEAVMPEVSVSDDDVEKELSRVQERNSRMIPAEDRAVMNGDTANIDYEGFLNGVPFEGGKGASYDLKIGSNSFIPGFEEQLIGHNAGETFDIDVTFPEDYHSEELKGKAVVFTVTVNSVKTRELPVLDDEFAKDVSEFDTLAEYRESLKTKLLENATKRAEGTFEDNVIETVVNNATVDIPHVMVDNEIGHMLDEQRNSMRYQGIELEQYLQYMGQTIDSYREQLHEPAEKRVRSQLVLEAIGKAENFEVTDEEIEAEIERMAAMYNMKAEDLKSRFAPGENSFVRDSVVHHKTIDKLTSSAIKVAPPAADAAVEAE
ncbi:MAG TPA: trigger factor [Clostridiales bacterium]|nr:trigger factor [Clostridiales bacterium]